jgi:hypothetical protein
MHKKTPKPEKIDLSTLFEGTEIDARQGLYYMTRIKMPSKKHQLYA